MCIPSAIKLCQNCYLAKVIKASELLNCTFSSFAPCRNTKPNPTSRQSHNHKYTVCQLQGFHTAAFNISVLCTRISLHALCEQKKLHLRTKYKVQNIKIQSPQANKINLSREDGQLKCSKIQHFIKHSKQLHHRQRQLFFNKTELFL